MSSPWLLMARADQIGGSGSFTHLLCSQSGTRHEELRAPRTCVLHTAGKLWFSFLKLPPRMYTVGQTQRHINQTSNKGEKHSENLKVQTLQTVGSFPLLTLTLDVSIQCPAEAVDRLCLSSAKYHGRSYPKNRNYHRRMFSTANLPPL